MEQASHHTSRSSRSALAVRPWPTLQRLQPLLLMGMLAVLATLLALYPNVAWAQDNPFANAAARQGAIGILQSLRFWVWIAAGVGFLAYLIAYFFQAAVPEIFQQFRGYLRTGAILVAVFGVIIEFIIAQANAAPTT